MVLTSGFMLYFLDFGFAILVLLVINQALQSLAAQYPPNHHRAHDKLKSPIEQDNIFCYSFANQGKVRNQEGS